jgi:nucleotide-binding universal stress UspA family protein
MKKILVPCDFSKQAVNAFRFALDLAAKSKGEVHLLNVVELPILHDSILMPVLSFEEQLLKELREKANERFEKITEKYPSGKVTLKTKVVFGATSHMILDYCQKSKIDLVVMGTKGVSGLRELVIGSNTEKIVRNATAPVIAVKKYPKAGSIKNIVVPNNLDPEGQKGLMLRIRELQSFFGATLHLVWINTPVNFYPDIVIRERLKDFAEMFSLKKYTLNIFNDLNEETGVVNFTNMINADMIAMGTHGRKGLAHAVSGSMAEDLVNEIECPIWTYAFGK